MPTTSKPQQASSSGTAITATGGTTIVTAPAAGSHLEIFAIQLSNSSATASLVHLLPAGGTKVYPSYLNANWPNVNRDLLASGQSWKLPTATALNMDQTAAGSIHYTIDYLIVPDGNQ